MPIALDILSNVVSVQWGASKFLVAGMRYQSFSDFQGTVFNSAGTLQASIPIIETNEYEYSQGFPSQQVVAIRPYQAFRGAIARNGSVALGYSTIGGVPSDPASGINKFNSNGSLAWGNSLSPRALALDSDGNVYASDTSFGVYRLNTLTGGIEWTSSHPSFFGRAAAVANTDVTDLDALIVSGSAIAPDPGVASFYAYNIATGAQIWSLELGTGFSARVAANGQKLGVVDGQNLVRLNPATGSAIWSVPLFSATSAPEYVAISNSGVFLAEISNFGSDDGIGISLVGVQEDVNGVPQIVFSVNLGVINDCVGAFGLAAAGDTVVVGYQTSIWSGFTSDPRFGSYHVRGFSLTTGAERFHFIYGQTVLTGVGGELYEPPPPHDGAASVLV